MAEIKIIPARDRSGDIIRTAAYARVSSDSEDQIKNVRMGFRKRMSDGTYVPSATPYGYIRSENGVRVDEEKEELVRRIFRDYLNGDGESTIAKRYEINIATVKYMLGNEKYIGDSLFHKWYTTDTLPFKCVKNNGEREMYYVPKTHQAIISREEYEMVQELKKEKGRHHRGKKTVSCPLRKKIYCGECGTLFKRKERKDRVCWVCRNHDQSSENCSIRQIEETVFYTAFITMFNKLTTHYQNIITPAYRQLQRLSVIGELANTQVAEIRKEIAEKKAQCHLLSQLNAQGVLDSVYFTTRSQELDRNLVQLHKQLHAMLNSDEDEEQLGKLKKLIAILESSEQITEFDEEKFSDIVERIIVLSEKEIRFELISGIAFNEPIQRKGR